MAKRKATTISLPLSRTQKIMVSAVGVQSVTQDIVALTTKATEIFLMDFARRAYDQSSDEEFRSNVLEYDDIQKLVHSDPRYDFLIDTTPKRIKFSEALKLVEEAKKRLKFSENTDFTQVTTTTKPESKEPTSDENINTHDNHGEEEEEEDEEEDDDQEDQEQVEEHGDEEGENDDDDNE